jgi:hypothetical protein
MANQAGTRTVRIVFSAVIMVTFMFFALSASAQVRRNGGGYGTGITVFTNPNFTGQSVSLRNDTPDLRGYSLNDKISSLEIANGESWEVCQDINYANRCQVFSGSVSNLRDMGWNDRISSLRRVNTGFNNGRQGGVYGSNRSQGLVLYDRPFFRGNSTTLVNSDSRIGLGNGLGSAQIRGGVWQLCDRNGRCATVSQDVPDLSRLGLSGRITSARLVNGSQSNSDRRFGRY